MICQRYFVFCDSYINSNSNMTSFFRFENKRAIYRLGIISLAHAPVHVTAFPVVNVHVDELSSARIWQINCVRQCRKRKYKLPSSNQSILPYLYFQTYQNQNNSWKPECVLSFNTGWRILVNFIPRLQLGIKY